MATPRVSRGRASQKLVAQWLKDHGIETAEAVPASLPGRDVLGTPGLAVEVKATEKLDLTGSLRQARKNANGDLPLVVYRPRGYGAEKLADWPVVMTLADLTALLQNAGLL